MGEKFANQTVIIENVDETEVRVTLAAIMPAREAWLHQNPQAKASVLQGIEDAKAGRLVDGPDLAADAKLANSIEDDDVSAKMDAAGSRSVRGNEGGRAESKGHPRRQQKLKVQQTRRAL